MVFVPRKKEKRESKKTDCVLKVDVKSMSFIAMETVRNMFTLKYIEFLLI